MWRRKEEWRKSVWNYVIRFSFLISLSFSYTHERVLWWRRALDEVESQNIVMCRSSEQQKKQKIPEKREYNHTKSIQNGEWKGKNLLRKLKGFHFTPEEWEKNKKYKNSITTTKFKTFAIKKQETRKKQTSEMIRNDELRGRTWKMINCW